MFPAVESSFLFSTHPLDLLCFNQVCDAGNARACRCHRTVGSSSAPPELDPGADTWYGSQYMAWWILLARFSSLALTPSSLATRLLLHVWCMGKCNRFTRWATAAASSFGLGHGWTFQRSPPYGEICCCYALPYLPTAYTLVFSPVETFVLNHR